MRIVWPVICLVLACGCALSRPDHFHALAADGPRPPQTQSAFVMQVNLRVSLPMMVDRSELVLNDAAGVTILEHERWAAPLGDQFANVLGQDIEARRPDAIVTSRSISNNGGAATTVAVDVVELSLHKGSGALMEARWRIQRGSTLSQGREIFDSKASGGSYGDLVSSLNACLGVLADRLVAQLP